MNKNVTLNEFIGELQRLAVEHGDDEILSIGSSSGKIAGMSSPFCFNFKGHDATEFVAAYQHDVKAQAEPAQGQGPRAISRLSAPSGLPSETALRGKKGQGVVSLRDDLNGAGARVNDVDLRHVWARVGMTLDITPEEEKAIFEGDYLEGKAAVKRVIEAGRASVDGETYIPEECIESFDEEYGTNYHEREDECAWSLDGDRVKVLQIEYPCKVGDMVYVPFYNEENGVTEIDELQVTEVSEKRIWVAGDDGFDYSADDIGRDVFLSREAAEAYIKSPEYLAERVNMVLHLNVSDNTKRDFLVASFAAGQEYLEPETERYLKLMARGPFDVWKFDVFDKNHELMYSEAALGVRLALDILNGELVPAAMAKEKSVSELISEASARSEKEDVSENKEHELDMN